MCRCNRGCSEPDGCPHNIKPAAPVRHKHAELVKAWADGAVIEARHKVHGRDWNVAGRPVWSEDYDYRLKPVKKTIGELMYNSWYKGKSLDSCWERCSIKGEWENAASIFLSAMREQDA